MKGQYDIENWWIEPTGSGGFWIRGLSASHDHRFDVGTPIHTSRLVLVDFERMEAETLNSVYKLGQPKESKNE